MVGLVHVRKWEKRNRSDVYWGVLKVCTGSIQIGGIEAFCLLRYWVIFSTISSLYANFFTKKSDNFYPKMFQYSQTKIWVRWQNMFPGGKMFQYPQFIYCWWPLQSQWWFAITKMAAINLISLSKTNTHSFLQ